MVRRLIVTLSLFLVILIGGLGYLGFIPGVSALFGSNHPVDLGTPYTEANRLSANQKFEQTFVSPSNGADPLALLQAADTQTIDDTFSAQEIAAHIEETHPVSDVQVRFNDDGSFEASGRIDKSRITSFLHATGISNIDQAGVLATIDKYLPGNPPFYLAGTGSVTDQKPSLELTAVKLGRLPLSPEPFASGLRTYATAVMDHVPHFDPAAITIENNQLHYVGTGPAVVPIY